ncbi:AAA family ATPase [Granulicatella adiacens]|jgi:hypothetical protein|uniref:AAA family ATPase n=1 Tax=Granulicatella adiacens TaxID=46124 RepID=UPI001C3D63D1|nr:AAA family ATPase [Granulicatella adiacens]
MQLGEVRLKKIEIDRDAPRRKKQRITLSSDLLTIIYGENGCGKTTFLRLISAIFSKNEKVLKKENVNYVRIVFESNGCEDQVYVRKKLDKSEDPDGEEILSFYGEDDDPFVLRYEYLEENHDTIYDWKDFNNSKLNDYKTVLFGVNRGLSTYINEVTAEDLRKIIIRSFSLRKSFKSRRDIDYFSSILSKRIEEKNRINHDINRNDIFSEEYSMHGNIIIDGMPMEALEELLVDRFKKVREVSSQKVQSALFVTLSEIIDSNNSQNDNSEEESLYLDGKERLLEALKDGVKNKLSDKIISILEETDDESIKILTEENEILKKVIANMSKELKEESQFIQTIGKLMKIFNEYIGPEKFIEISDKEVVVKFLDSDEKHPINILSSGEKHLLILLTLFVIEGDRKQLFMVDEPEISLNIKWQRKLSHLLKDLAPNSEIILASHSPSIAHDYPKSLVELVNVNDEV